MNITLSETSKTGFLAMRPIYKLVIVLILHNLGHFCMHFFVCLLNFKRNYLFQSNLSGIQSECRTVWITVRCDFFDHGPNCMQRLLPDDKSPLVDKSSGICSRLTNTAIYVCFVKAIESILTPITVTSSDINLTHALSCDHVTNVHPSYSSSLGALTF